MFFLWVEVSCLLAGLRGVGGSVIAIKVVAEEVLIGELAAVGAAGVGDALPEKI